MKGTGRITSHLVAMGLLLLGMALVLTRSIHGASATANSAAAQGCWKQVPATSGGLSSNELKSVAVVNANDIWAVGTEFVGSSVGGNPNTLAMHWNGRTWTRVPSPSPGSRMGRDGRLSTVAAVSSNDVWAMGSYARYSWWESLILHWDGARWTHVPNPEMGLDNQNELFGLAAISANDIWAVGYLFDSRGGAPRVLMHWDGNAWTWLPAITGQGAPQALNAISASSANDIWAVGTGPGFLHWNGSGWRAVPIPVEAEFLAVTAISPTDAWAVGRATISGDPPRVEGVALHWDGTRWTRTQIPDPGVHYTLYGVSAVAPNNVWGVGGTITGITPKGSQSNTGETYVIHWNGATWEKVASENAGEIGFSALHGIDSLPNGNAWAVGAHSNRLMLVERYSETACPSTTSKPLDPPIPVPGSGSRTFPETGKTVTGVFLDYWNSHGGLPQQGYPISDVIGEASDLDGKLYTMQYFERAVFEYHPEHKGTPYEVLLSQLGTFEYKKKYPNGAPNQKPNTSAGSIFFRETGKRLGGAFHYYWVNHGGLMQQGFPISDEFMEVSPLDGKAYTVQYFERAVFEWHPENRGTPYEVLLSHLGRFRYNDKYITVPPGPGATSTPAAGQSRRVASNVLGRVAGNDRYLFWVSDQAPTYPIYGYDLDSRRTFLVTDRPTYKFSLAADDRTLVWAEGDVEGTSFLKGYDINSQREFAVTEALGPGALGEDTMAVDGAMLYYVGQADGAHGIIARNISTRQQNLLIRQGRNPVLYGDVLLWSKEVANCIPGNNHPPCVFEQELYVRKANQDRLLARAGGQIPFEGYDVWGDNVVWTYSNPAYAGSPPNIYSITTGTNTRISERPGNHPRIHDDLVIWAAEPDTRPGGDNFWSIEAHNASNGTRYTLLPRSDSYTEVQHIAWQKAVAYTVGQSRHPLTPGRDLYVLEWAGRVR